MKGKERNIWAFIGLIPFVVIMLGFLVGPFLVMVLLSIQKGDGSGFTFEIFKEVFQNQYYLQSMKNSITIALASSVIGLIISLLAAYFITKVSSKIQDVVLSLSNLTSNFSGIPLAFSFIIMLGNSGLFVLFGEKIGFDFLSEFDLFSWTGMTLLYVYFQIPLGMMLLYPAFHGIKEEWKQAADLLGANVFQFWKAVGLPILAPGIAGVFSILFANAMGAYASAYALAGSNFNILPIQIGGLIAGDVFSRTDLASALAVVLACILIISLLFNEFMMKKVRRDIR